MYRQIQADRLIIAIDQLFLRISDRFPDSGLAGTCRELSKIARESRQRTEWIARPLIWLRVGVGLFVLLVLLGVVAAVASSPLNARSIGLLELIAVTEAAINDVILIGAAIFFLVNVEGRLKRNRALDAIHELRALAHTIDIRQLTKDPERVLKRGAPAQNSPASTMTRFELTRYLDYSSEMLSLTGKIAALYAQCVHDAVALAAVSEVEALCSGFSQKIWQKIMILHTVE